VAPDSKSDLQMQPHGWNSGVLSGNTYCPTVSRWLDQKIYSWHHRFTRRYLSHQ